MTVTKADMTSRSVKSFLEFSLDLVSLRIVFLELLLPLGLLLSIHHFLSLLSILEFLSVLLSLPLVHLPLLLGLLLYLLFFLCRLYSEVLNSLVL